MRKYINVNLDKLEKGKFNMIASGTGTGKTYFISNELVKRFPANKVLFVTSRSAIAEQQEFSINNKGLDLVAKKISAKDGVNLFNKDSKLDSNRLNICCYNTLIDMLMDEKAEERLLNNIDVIVFDECHTIQIDTFINNIGVVKTFINDTLTKVDRYLIGLSATPQPLINWLDSINKETNFLCKYLVNYKAKNVVFTDEDSLQRLYLDGINKHKSIILVDKVDRGLELVDMLRTLNLNAQLLVSRNNEEYDKSMDITRNYILENEKLPTDLDVLICTTAYREGINIYDESVQTVISYYGDFLHLTQFMGRLRQETNNLIVINNPRLACKTNTKASEYKEKCNKDIKFSQYLANISWKTNMISEHWYKSIKPIINCEHHKIAIYHTSNDSQKFVQYILDNYLVPKYTNKTDMVEKYALTKERKDNILDKAIECNIHKEFNSKLTFKKVAEWLEIIGFKIVSKQIQIDGKRERNKYIVEYISTKNKGVTILDTPISKEDTEIVEKVAGECSTEEEAKVNTSVVEIPNSPNNQLIDYVRVNYMNTILNKEIQQDIFNKATELGAYSELKSKLTIPRLMNNLDGTCLNIVNIDKSKKLIGWLDKEYKLVDRYDYFIKYIKNEFLVPEGTSKERMFLRYALNKEKQKEIVAMAKECRILDCYNSDVTFAKVEEWLLNKGFTLEEKQIQVDKKRAKNKYIVAYN